MSIHVDQCPVIYSLQQNEQLSLSFKESQVIIANLNELNGKFLLSLNILMGKETIDLYKNKILLHLIT